MWLKTHPMVTLEHAQGRPNAKALLAAAHEANAPGIFTRGPVALTGVIRKETGKENSMFGYTCFCMYDESFEM